MVQQEEELVDNFMIDLYSLMQLHDEMMRDRIIIVVGIKDSKLSEKLQMDNELKTISLARNSESVKQLELGVVIILSVIVIFKCHDN